VNRNSDESGSAIAEFVLIATPLFIPALIFFASMQQSAKEEMTVSTLARQSLRALITADNLSLGHQRIQFLLDQYQEIENKGRNSDDIRSGFTYNISCQSQGCLTPGSLVELSLYRSFAIEVNDFDEAVAGDNRKAAAVVRGYVDKWRDES
jgi:Flp pilus assembly protein TadG